MLDETFARGFVHELAPDFTPGDPWSAHRVLGLPLRPFCLWHRLMLETIESPLLDPRAVVSGSGFKVSGPSTAPQTGDAQPETRNQKPETFITPADLKRAVAVCRCRFRQWQVLAPLTFRDHLRTAHGGFAREMDAFNAYILDFTSRPDYSIKTPGNPRPSGGGSVGQPPETFRQVAELIGWSHWQAQVCWELPVSEVEWYLAQAVTERCGALGSQVDFLTAEDREFQRQLKEKQARERAEKLRDERTASPLVESQETARSAPEEGKAADSQPSTFNSQPAPHGRV